MTGPILVKHDPVGRIDKIPLEEIRETLTKQLTGRKIHACYVFGSVATKTAGVWSDLDLIIVTDTPKPFIERPRDFFDLYDLGFALDLLVYTPKEFQKLTSEPIGFWKSFNREAVRVI